MMERVEGGRTKCGFSKWGWHVISAT